MGCMLVLMVINFDFLQTTVIGIRTKYFLRLQFIPHLKPSRKTNGGAFTQRESSSEDSLNEMYE